ncbi:MAG: DUF5060 domain-containing protein [Planctomycetota bacterium]
MLMTTRSVLTLASMLLAAAGVQAQPSVTLDPPVGTAYQPISIDLDTQQLLSETGIPNPFLDRRLNVTLTSPSGNTFAVPGFFAGDGTGATSTSSSGSVFRVRFTPDEQGTWSYEVSFRQGGEVAIDLDSSAGTPGPGNGISGGFQVLPPEPGAPGFLSKGRLRWVGEHYLRFQDGDAYIKTGADSPENWLGYVGFDNTEDDGGAGVPGTGLHTFAPHLQDWSPGDPDWDRTDPPSTNDGRAIIGALNYLESVGVNSIYFLPMNIGGDARDTWPYAGPINGGGSSANDNTRFDVSKLAQWDIVFGHAQAKGIMLHFVLNEAEAPNKRELDDAELGVERKLFYREMIARFGYHNALTFNISEEYNLNLNLGPERVIDFASYIAAVDPYGIPLTVHNAGNGQQASGNGPWVPFIGQPDFDLTSLQRARAADGWGDAVADFRTASAAAGRPLAVMVDEPASPTRDVENFDEFRKRVVWDILLSGGGGEWFINNRDQSLEDFREFEKIWLEAGIARRFLEDNLPFDGMTPDNALVSGESGTFGGAEVFAKPGQVYAVYWPEASDTGSINLSGVSHPTQLRWFNPRTGAFVGDAIAVPVGMASALPLPPSNPDEDWAAILEVDPCPGDVNRDGLVTDSDFFAWVTAFITQSPGCDQNGDTLCTDSDYFVWLIAFEVGCPSGA